MKYFHVNETPNPDITPAPEQTPMSEPETGINDIQHPDQDRITPRELEPIANEDYKDGEPEDMVNMMNTDEIPPHQDTERQETTPSGMEKLLIQMVDKTPEE